MVNTRTDTNLSVAVQNALQPLLPQIRAEIHEEFRTSSGPSDAGGNPPPERLKRKYHTIRQTNTEISTELMQRFFDLLGSSEQLLVPRRSRQRIIVGSSHVYP
nr:hypothetical protein [Tanacetum cinerariifolium]